jgi:hypothetical protein
MSNASGASTQWNLPNLIGEIGIVNKATTFLNDIAGGAEAASRWAQAQGFQFVCGNLISLEAASQPAITETASLTAPTATTFVPDQEYNACQIYQRSVNLSYAALSDTNMLSGLTIAGATEPDKKMVQVLATMRQIAVDLDYTFLNGAFQAATNAGVAWKTRGVIAACTGHSTSDISAADLDQDAIEAVLATMSAAGADFEDMAIYVNAYNLRLLSGIYGFAPMDRRVGGLAIERIVTPFCELAVRFDPAVPAATVALVDRAKCRPVGLPAPNVGVLGAESLARTGAADAAQVYGQVGIDYGSWRFHGTITNTATS